MSKHINHYDELDNEVQEALNHFEYPANDWNVFFARYRRYKTIKRLKYTILAGTTIAFMALAVYWGISTPQKISPTKNHLPETQEISSQPAKHHSSTPVTPSQSSSAASNTIVLHQSSKSKPLATNSTPSLPVSDSVSHSSTTSPTSAAQSPSTPKSQQQPSPTPPLKHSKVVPHLQLSRQTACINTDITIQTDISNPTYTYLWSIDKNTFQGASTLTTRFQSEGTHTISLMLRDSSGKLIGKTSTYIQVISHPNVSFNISTDDETYTIRLIPRHTSDFSWTLDNISHYTTTAETFSLENEGQHTIIAIIRNKGCADTIRHSFEVYAPIKMFIPTAFVPDNNGLNDTFGPTFSKDPKDYKLLIFDAHGKLIFNTTNPQKQWDGRINGIITPGIYQWNIVYRDVNNTIVKKTGQVQLQIH